ncbi:MAG TPA: hypothetical protein VF603_05955 [Allosphingosinicella sp.]|jgi:hypothetical protein
MLLAGCSSEPTASNQNAAQNDIGIPAQTVAAASHPVEPQSPYPPGYAELRDAAAAYRREFGSDDARDDDELTEVPGQAPFINLLDCVEDGMLAGPLAPTGANEQHFWLARRVERIRHRLARSGYPPAAYEEPLAAYEASTLEHFSRPQPSEASIRPRSESEDGEGQTAEDAVFDRLARDINQRRENLRVTAPPTGVDRGCGAGESPFIVRADPRNGRVWMLRAYDFHLCRIRTGRPWDLNACRWLEMDGDRPSYLSGRYVYQATWPGGRSIRGNRVLDEGTAMAAGGGSDQAAIVTIRP